MVNSQTNRLSRIRLQEVQSVHHPVERCCRHLGGSGGPGSRSRRDLLRGRPRSGFVDGRRIALFEETRRELADTYLRDQGLSIREVAYLLEFAEPANFARAFTRWYGVSLSNNVLIRWKMPLIRPPIVCVN